MSIKQQSQEKVHHFWARFLLVKDKVKDCHDEDAISTFCKNCADEGILNAINQRRILKFADLATIVQKYCTMEGAWETLATRGNRQSQPNFPYRRKGRTLVARPIQQSKNTKPLHGKALF